ncbi:uncharacterized protein DUF1566 [Desulfobotulus alkaliphilus]|uniref:Uncharacterized protein DUF1566 n=1 Tax=Desulfobotulus alkaliphilus TaxID=622671 RepID=A0A562S2K9_9BACT|nr:DUF1566 domain-containing protein [Desulfobotulus alkaliphilus]TWI75378.1 uncharacterized protein DUF1566 [Desulfobotulus alkaliphilus]
MKPCYLFIYLSLIATLLFSSSLVAETVCSGSENTAIISTTPTVDFDIHLNGTVTHKPTGLMWMRCSLGQVWDGSTCMGDASRYSWQGALQETQDFNAAGGFAGHTDWRLPNINEMESIVERRCYEPAIHGDVFPQSGLSSPSFWSSSPFAVSNNSAWSLYFSSGGVTYFSKLNRSQVRLVRGG